MNYSAEQINSFFREIEEWKKRAENAERERDEALKALAKFSGFGAFLKAVSEHQQFELKPETCITSIMAGGGSDYLWWSDFEDAIKIYEALSVARRESEI